MSRLLMRSRSRPRSRGFTLTELLVVILIIMIVSAVALPTVIPALTNRQIGESARILQAALAGARDSAIRYNAPRGIRLLPDVLLSPLKQTATGTITGGALTGQVLTSSRIIPIEPAPDLTDSSVNGSATFVNTNFTVNPPFIFSSWSTGSPPRFPVQIPGAPTLATYPFPFFGTNQVLIVAQSIFANNNPGGTVNPPTNWFWNVRIGDKFRPQDSGRYYTVVGPMTMANPEGFVNDGPPEATSSLTTTYFAFSPGNPPTPVQVNPEYLFLVNGYDDDGDGFVDNGFDGVDENYNSYTDDILEWSETESWFGAHKLANTAAQADPRVSLANPHPFPWTITRRPVPSPGAREVALSAGAVIDLTTWDTTTERSRLPVNPFNGTVDILLNQAGQVVPTTLYSNPGSFAMAQSFYHFWIADRGDVYAPGGATFPSLPVSSTYAGTAPGTFYFTQAPPVFLKKDRKLLTLFTKTGAVVTNSIENFDVTDVNRPFDDAQLGIREAK